jgi:hypothetical protein
MKHLTEHELSAHLDQALDPSERRRVDAHLETCAGCRASLAELAAQDRGVASALAHDPGDAYFESFAARVEDRIRAQGLAGAQAHPERFEGPWRWLKSPRALAWAGGLAAVVVGSGIILMTGRDVQMPNLHQPRWTERVSRAPAPAAGKSSSPSTESREQPAAELGKHSGPLPPSREAGSEMTSNGAAGGNAGSAGSNAGMGRSNAGAIGGNQAATRRDAGRINALDQQAATPQKLEAAPGRAYEVKRNSMGDEAPVAVRPLPGAQLGSQPAPATGPEPAYAKRQRRAEPMSSAPVADKQAPAAPPTAPEEVAQKTAPAPTTQSAPAPSAADEKTDRLAARESGARVSTEARAAESAARRCGLIRDPSGRPVANAQVIVPETGSSVTTAADGSFCVDTPPQSRTLITMAVGFETESRLLPADGGPISVTLHAISVVGGAMAMKPQGSSGSPVYGFAGPPKSGASGALESMAEGGSKSEAPDPFSALPGSVRAVIETARNLEADAARAKSANQYEAAALEWERALKLTGDAPAANELRYRIAAARHTSWQLDPTRERMIAAMSSASTFLLRAPRGSERDQAEGWFQQLRWGTNRALYR